MSLFVVVPVAATVAAADPRQYMLPSGTLAVLM
jgi:hypothetical protein